jgi:hypothetical protein
MEVQSHPHAFYDAIREAKRIGLWVKADYRAIPGRGIYVVTRAKGYHREFTHDDIEEVRAWILCKANTGATPRCLTL